MKSVDVNIIFCKYLRPLQGLRDEKRTLVSTMGICKTLNSTKCSRVFYIIIANYCIKSCRTPKEF